MLQHVVNRSLSVNAPIKKRVARIAITFPITYSAANVRIPAAEVLISARVPWSQHAVRYEEREPHANVLCIRTMKLMR
jgi:hypothetical protein